jgi:hypothetical protein
LGGSQPGLFGPAVVVPGAVDEDVEDAAWLVADALGTWLAFPSVVCVGTVGLAAPAASPALVGAVVRCSDMLTGTATPTAAATAAALASEITALRILRRLARLVISAKVPEGGGSGRTCWFSQ